MQIFLKNYLLWVLIFIVVSGCSHRLKDYEEFAAYTRPGNKSIRLPVIIVPGVKGSLLKRGDKNFWGKSYRVAFFHTFDKLKFPIKDQLDANFQGEFGKYYDANNVKDGGVMEKYKIAMGFLNLFNISIYRSIRKVLERSGGYSYDRDLFMFSYDWRLDNRISATHLAHMVTEYQDRYMIHIKKNILPQDEGALERFKNKLNKYNLLTSDGRIKVNLVTHSMGGLVARYYIQMLGGENRVNKLIMLGTPNQGAMDALKAISEGEFPESIWHFYSEEKTRPVIFSWPSTYQLLPRYAHGIKRTDRQERPNLNAWGLGNSISVQNDGVGLDAVADNWLKYSLIPEELMGDDASQKMTLQYLKEQLESASKFHGAINGKIDRAYETKKLNLIEDFGRKAKISVNAESDFIDGHAETPFILFGGHCQPTLKYVYSRESGNNTATLEFDDPLKNKHENKSYTMGDGRVPIQSLRVMARENPSDFQFLLCEGHTSMISNTTFQYNLLRELLWQSHSLNLDVPMKTGER